MRSTDVKMATMESCSQRGEEMLLCPVRKSWAKALPEEVVRHRLLHFMIDKLHFPLSSLVVEKALNQMPHLALKPRQELPDRRADIVCYAKGIHPGYDLYPLLLIECKAVALTQSVIQQVLGYNQHVEALFVAVANEKEMRTGWFDREKRKYQFIPYIPSYDQLIRSL